MKLGLIFFLTALILFAGCGTEVLAQTKSPSPTSKVSARIENLLLVVKRYTDHLDKMVTRSNKLLDTLQTRVVRAKSAGKDTAKMESLVTSARVNLAEAQTNLAEVKRLTETASARADFQAIRTKFKAIKTNLQVAHKDISEVVRLLRGLNSRMDSTTSGKLTP